MTARRSEFIKMNHRTIHQCIVLAVRSSFSIFCVCMVMLPQVSNSWVAVKPMNRKFNSNESFDSKQNTQQPIGIVSAKQSITWCRLPGQNVIQWCLSSTSSSSCNESDNDDPISSSNDLSPTSYHMKSRRQLLVQSVSAVSSGMMITGYATTSNAVPSIVTSVAVCDPTVSVWKLGGANERIVYILGTAHISEVSAELAGRLVQDTHPNAVFVELDLKRVGGVSRSMAMPQREQGQQQPSALVLEGTSDESSTPIRIVVPIISQGVTETRRDVVTDVSPAVSVAVGSDDDSQTAIPPPPPPPPVKQPPSGGLFYGIQRSAMNFASAAVGSALKGMYKNLGTAGFNPGEEFMTAIAEGRKINADIILGDQDVEVTLRRLTQALSVTDFNKLIATDSEFEKSMNELLPGADPTKIQPMIQNYDDPAQFKADLSEYIEKLKSRSNVRKIMEQLNVVAPALVEAMLTERDAYMAAGIDTLNRYECIVAVMGIAHMDGVESNLLKKGWKQVKLQNCPKS